MQPYSDELIESVFRQLKEQGTLSKQTTLTLYSIFDKTVFESLQLAEGKQVKRAQSDSGRAVYRVSNECIAQQDGPISKTINTCMIKPRHCNCDIFINNVILGNDMIMCRHILAVKLSECLNLVEIDALKDKAFAQEYKRWLSS